MIDSDHLASLAALWRGEFLPSEEVIRVAIDPYRAMTPVERIAVQSELSRAFLATLGPPPRVPDDHPEAFWRYWVDPMYGIRKRRVDGRDRD